MAVPAPDVTARLPRIPKLTYRNSSPHTHSDHLPSHSEPAMAVDSSPKPPDLTETIASNPSSTSTARYSQPSSDSRSTTSSTHSSLASSIVSTSKSSKASSNKKKNAVLGFLTVKEPSQVAFEQFAKSQRQQSSSKSSSFTPRSSQNHISLQKLPSNVPKVNSKWDGLPGSVRSSQLFPVSSARSSTTSPKAKSLPGYNPALDTSKFSIMSTASQGPPPSLASPMASVADVSYETHPASAATAPLRSPSQTSLPEISCYFPSNSNLTSDTLPTSPLPRSPSGAPHVESQLCEQRSSRSPSPNLMEDEIGDEDASTEAENVFRKLQGDHAHLTDEANATMRGRDSGAIDGVPETHDFLFETANPENLSTYMDVRPPTYHSSSRGSSFQETPRPQSGSPQFEDRPARLSPSSFSRPRPPSSRVPPYRTSPFTLPTLYEVSVASTDTITDFMDGRESRIRRSFDSMSIAESATDSIAPSEMSESWDRTPKDRLGLGGRLIRNGVLPWENDDEAVSVKPKKSRLSVFSKFS